ncbi:hypothetical protein FACS1894176_02300 [Bacteroidia bacterium]|nr:hypothetical protein FACS1894176_02300 [Bacteroidia bacterium]
MKYGISYAGQLENGGYKLKLLPLSHQGKILDIDVSGYTKVGKNGQINSFVNVYGLNKAFYGETEYVHDL